jgi:hypothetical protein
MGPGRKRPLAGCASSTLRSFRVDRVPHLTSDLPWIGGCPIVHIRSRNKDIRPVYTRVGL